MRRLTRRVLGIIVFVSLALLALGALPSYLGSGDPYYLTATPTNASGPAINATELSERRFPYTTEALRTGRSAGYRTGRYGFKEAFSHSPFDEYSALDMREPGEDGYVLVEYKGQRYRIELTHA